MADVDAELSFIVDTGKKPVAATVGPSGRIEHVGEFVTRAVRIEDGRRRRGEHSLDREGFRLVDHPTRVADLHDVAEVRGRYHAEVEGLLRSTTGGTRVEIFDHTVRSGDAEEQERLRVREPVAVPHNDYTEWSGPNRLALALPDAADALGDRRFAIIQVWRATHEPIQRDPLAVCDARSVRPEHLLAAERRHRDRVGEIYQLLHAAEHRWTWFPEMRREEALVFKVYDSATDGRARFTPHASFALPDPPPEAPPRRSIEVRAFVFFD